MALLTHAQEYQAVRLAIQAFTTDSTRQVYSGSIGDLSFTYSVSQIPQLQERERELAKRLSVRNTRKRTTPDFTGGSSGLYIPP